MVNSCSFIISQSNDKIHKIMVKYNSERVFYVMIICPFSQNTIPCGYVKLVAILFQSSLFSKYVMCKQLDISKK